MRQSFGKHRKTRRHLTRRNTSHSSRKGVKKLHPRCLIPRWPGAAGPRDHSCPRSLHTSQEGPGHPQPPPTSHFHVWMTPTPSLAGSSRDATHRPLLKAAQASSDTRTVPGAPFSAMPPTAMLTWRLTRCLAEDTQGLGMLNL